MTAASIAASAAIAVLASGAIVTAYHRAVVRPALAIGVVDVGAVYRVKEVELGVLLGAGDDERQRAVRMAREFADRVGLALEQLSADCACLLVSSGALATASPRAVDLTPVLLGRMESPRGQP